MTWPHRGKVQLASDNTHLADLRTLPMPRADHAALGKSDGTHPDYYPQTRLRPAKASLPVTGNPDSGSPHHSPA